MSGHGVGTSINRQQSSGRSEVATQQERRNEMFSSPMPVLRRAVVLDVFYDPTLITEEVRTELTDTVANKNMVPHIRRNCILAQQISGDGSRTSAPTIYYPLLDPYVGLPCKPGETVLTIHEDPSAAPGDTPYWICRAPAPISVDDLSYTHDDRKHIPTDLDQDAIDKLEGASANEPPGFPNGAPGDDSITIGDKEEAFDEIWNSATATAQIPVEAVPRWSKRPGDTVLQGSNNTLISLGTDRIGPVTEEDEAEEGRGCIDVVVGRGLNEATAPNIIENSRNQQEVDKVPGLRELEDVPSEGDPDFEFDACRFYMCSRTNVDVNFGIDIQDGGEESEGNKAAMMLKTDQLRLVGRDDIKIQADSGDGQGAAIILKANGNIILIPGPAGLIYLGGESANLASLGNVGVGTAGSVVGQPILSTMGGVTGTPSADPHGAFSTKVLLKGQ